MFLSSHRQEFKGKKVVLFAVPGAFTPGCQVKHLPPYVERYEEFKQRGVDIVGVISANDAYVGPLFIGADT
jgi:alkyl hydroperoxide reductase 1